MKSLNNNMNLCIIIPAYNAKDTIEKTLESIKKQKLSIKFEVIIVNDCSDYDYKKNINKYKKYYKIREIKTKINSGPGVARQLGIDNSNSKYIIFIDADDYFYDEKSIYKMYKKAINTDSDLLISNFIYQRDGIEIVKKKNFIWLHGKVYKRDFLKKNNIRFNKSRSNEDTGFNMLICFLNPKISFLDKIVYVYRENSKSITRKNSRNYKFYGIEGFCYNSVWAVEEAKLRNVSKNEFKLFSIDIITTLYFYYIFFKDRCDVDKIFLWGSKIKKIYDEYNKKTKNDEIERFLEKKKIQLLDEIKVNDYNISFIEFLKRF